MKEEARDGSRERKEWEQGEKREGAEKGALGIAHLTSETPLQCALSKEYLASRMASKTS